MNDVLHCGEMEVYLAEHTVGVESAEALARAGRYMSNVSFFDALHTRSAMARRSSSS